MGSKKLLTIVPVKIAFVIVCAILGFCAPGSARSESSPAQSTEHSPSTNSSEYRIGPGDVLSLIVADAPEFGGRFRVDDSGVIELPVITSPVHAEGQTPIELAHSIRDALVDAKQLRDPKVTVFVEEYHGRTITVLGAVSKPGVYSLQKRTTLLEAVSMAGGALPNSGNTVTIVRGRASAETSGTAVGSVQTLDLARLVKGQDPSDDLEVRKGDVVNVASAQIVYVVGAVIKPGGFVMADPSSGVSVVQAVALAEGFRPVAASHRGLIIRQSTSDHARQEIPVDVAQMMQGKISDAVLAPNDILYIPESGMKKTLKVMGDVAMATANGIAVYGIGYRLGTQ